MLDAFVMKVGVGFTAGFGLDLGVKGFLVVLFIMRLTQSFVLRLLLEFV